MIHYMCMGFNKVDFVYTEIQVTNITQESSNLVPNNDHLFYMFIKLMCGTWDIHAIKERCPPSNSLFLCTLL